MTTEFQREQQDRRRVLRDDARLREQQTKDQSGTFLSHTHIDDAGGRFAAVNAASVVGAEPLVTYPQLPSSSPWAGPDPVPDEPPLGYEVNRLTDHELEPSMTSSTVDAQAGGAEAPSPSPGSMSENAAPSPSPDQPEHTHGPPMAGTED
jgi:hypothetical protein